MDEASIEEEQKSIEVPHQFQIVTNEPALDKAKLELMNEAREEGQVKKYYKRDDINENFVYFH